MIIIREKSNCTGCHACLNICPRGCISMVPDEEGFLYPLVDQKICSKCGLCEKVCPTNKHLASNNNPQAYAAWNNVDSEREASSSGGVFSVLCEYVLENSGVIFGAAFDEDLALCHSMAEGPDDYHKFRGSKYLQSLIGDVYKQAKEKLEANKTVLFSGTPCQIAGLISFLGRSYDNLITCDLACHGVPTSKVFDKYLLWLEKHYGSCAQNVNFRYKKQGWKRYFVSVSFENGSEYLEPAQKDPFMQGYLKNVYLRPSCHHCQFSRIPRVADISLADFWGVSSLCPEWDDDKGTSLILVNTEKGHTIINCCQDKLLLHNAPLNKAIAFNPCICGPVRPSRKRGAFFRDLERVPFETIAKKYCMDSFAAKLKNRAISLFYKWASRIKHK